MNDQYHEPYEVLDKATRDITRAVKSLIEELEAIDWYNQRMVASDDPDLIAILEHNRDEEAEHAAMTLEWLRRKLPVLDRELRDNLFKEGPIVGQHGHDHDHDHETPRSTSRANLNIGSLKK